MTKFSLTLFFFLFYCNCLSQEIVLHGSVVDGETLEALPGVHVFSDLKNGTIADIDGNFHLSVQFGDTIRFSMLGYDSLALVVTDTASYQSLFISLKERSIELDEVEIKDFYQGNTILENAPTETIRVPGANYPENPEGKNYRLGVGGVIFSPATAIYRLTSKSYKEEKRHHVELVRDEKEKEYYEKARKVFYEALEVIGENFDEYYMVDLFNFMGLSIREVANLAVYDFVKVLPEALEKYYAHRSKSEEAK